MCFRHLRRLCHIVCVSFVEYLPGFSWKIQAGFDHWRSIILGEKFSTEERNGRKKVLYIVRSPYSLEASLCDLKYLPSLQKLSCINFSSTSLFSSPSLVSTVTLLQHLLAPNVSVAPTRRRSTARLRHVSSANSSALLIEKRREEGR